jgi:hypothetical protein
VDLAHVRSVFSRLPSPDLVIHLRVDPAVAAARKDAFAASEAGNREGPAELSADAFTAYQRRLDGVLAGFATEGGWASLEVTGLDVQAVAGAVARMVRERLPAPPSFTARRAAPAGSAGEGTR